MWVLGRFCSKASPSGQRPLHLQWVAQNRYILLCEGFQWGSDASEQHCKWDSKQNIQQHISCAVTKALVQASNCNRTQRGVPVCLASASSCPGCPSASLPILEGFSCSFVQCREEKIALSWALLCQGWGHLLSLQCLTQQRPQSTGRHFSGRAKEGEEEISSFLQSYSLENLRTVWMTTVLVWYWSGYDISFLISSLIE